MQITIMPTSGFMGAGDIYIQRVELARWAGSSDLRKWHNVETPSPRQETDAPAFTVLSVRRLVVAL